VPQLQGVVHICAIGRQETLAEADRICKEC
jgi:hypothetical protein